MICSPVVGFSLLLISLTAGAWLLYKTQKENLGGFFKFIAWFVIVGSFLGMICCALCCVSRCSKRSYRCGGEGAMECRMDRSIDKKVVVYRGGGGCEMEEGKCCKEMKGCEREEACEENEACCEEERETKQDTAVKKK